MAPKSLEPWLSAFIRAEIDAVIDWKHQLESYPEIKRDPDERFSDDGSNFRSRHTSLSPERCRLQLIEVLTVEVLVAVIVSDGETRIRASLSKEMIAILEGEIEGKLDFTTIGDVFKLKQCTVKSTPYGPSDEFIQLFIEDIDYECHFRKLAAATTQIQEVPEIRRLIKLITELRQKEYPVYQDQDEDDPPESHQPSGSSVLVKTEVLSNPDRSGEKTPHLTQAHDYHSQKTPSNLVSQSVTTHRKRRRSSLDEDGRKGPQEVHTQPSNDRSPLHPPPMTSTGKETLLNLLRQGQQARPTKTTQPTAVASSPQIINETPIHRSKAAKITPVLPAASQNWHDQNVLAQGRQSISPVEAIPKEKVAPLSGPPQPSIPHGRQKFPENQHKLLRWQSAWIPTLPGHGFPKPNVPIDLLKKWTTAQPPLPKWLIKENPQSPKSSNPHSSNVSMISSDESDEILPWNQDSPSAKSAKGSLPPTSPAPSIRYINLDDDELEMAAPRELPFRKSPGGHQDSVRSRYSNALPSESPSRIATAASSNSSRETTPIAHSLPSEPDEHLPHEHHQTLEDHPSHAENPIASSAPLTSKSPADRLLQPSATRDYVHTNLSGGSRDPAEKHREARKEFFHSGKRRDWLVESYAPDPTATSYFYTLFNQYKDSHPEDASVRDSSFLQAVAEAFPKKHISKLMTFREKEKKWNEAPSREGKFSFKRFSQRNNNNNENEQSNSSEKESPLQSGILRGGNHTRGSEESVPTEALPVFVEFYQNYTNIEPGGAFAEPQLSSSSPWTRPMGIDVLSWDVE